MTKTFPNAVIWNGEIIPANTPIEDVEKTTEEKTVTENDNKRAGRKPRTRNNTD